MPYSGNPDSLWRLLLPVLSRDVIATQMAGECRSTDKPTIEAAATLPAGDSIAILISIASRADKGRADLRLLVLWHFDVDRRTS